MLWLKELFAWFTTLFSGQPHFIIGQPNRPYMLRWYLIPRNTFLNVYLHKFLRSDDDRALHDHPWWFVSLMIRGGYYELLERGAEINQLLRRAPSIALRRCTDRHRVSLFADHKTGEILPCWTIVVTGPKIRTWGFWCPKGFVPWFDFVDHSSHGNTGKGCGE